MSEKKDIIIKEIKYWKSHKLLPEQYCDFLLTLYSQGEMEETKETKSKLSIIKKVAYHFLIYFLVAQVPITFLVIYFTEMSFVLQMGMVIMFILISIGVAFYMYKQEQPLIHLPIITSSLLLFVASVHFVGEAFSNNISMLGTIIMNCLVWLFIGYKMRVNYLIIAGGIGAIISIIYFII